MKDQVRIYFGLLLNKLKAGDSNVTDLSTYAFFYSLHYFIP